MNVQYNGDFGLIKHRSKLHTVLYTLYPNPCNDALLLLLEHPHSIVLSGSSCPLPDEAHQGSGHGDVGSEGPEEVALLVRKQKYAGYLSLGPRELLRDVRADL